METLAAGNAICALERSQIPSAFQTESGRRHPPFKVPVVFPEPFFMHLSYLNDLIIIGIHIIKL